MKNYLFIFLLWSITFWPIASFSQESARVQAMGDAGHALLSISDSLFLNPAISIHIPLYTINASLYSTAGKSEYTYSVVDGTSKLFSAGIGYTKFKERVQWDASLSHKVQREGSIGLSVTHLTKSDSEKSLTSIGIGIFYAFKGFFPSLIDTLNTGAAIKGLAGDPDRLTKTLDVGISFKIKDILLMTFDWGFPIDNKVSGNSFRIGSEVTVIYDFSLRGGYLNNKVKRFKAPTFGIGWKAPKISFDYANQKREDLDGGAKSTYSIFTLSIFFN